MHLDGTMSTFGGPHDHGVGSKDGLALVDSANFDTFKDVFLEKQPKGTSGLARRLDPSKMYLACRWDYVHPTLAELRKGIFVKVTNPATGIWQNARPVDWGPHEKTGRVADLSPGLAQALGLDSDARVTIDWP